MLILEVSSCVAVFKVGASWVVALGLGGPQKKGVKKKEIEKIKNQVVSILLSNIIKFRAIQTTAQRPIAYPADTFILLLLNVIYSNTSFHSLSRKFALHFVKK